MPERSSRRPGRPRRREAASDAVVQVRMTRAERADLLSVARDNQVSVAELVREAVNECVADYRDRRVF